MGLLSPNILHPQNLANRRGLSITVYRAPACPWLLQLPNQTLSRLQKLQLRIQQQPTSSNFLGVWAPVELPVSVVNAGTADEMRLARQCGRRFDHDKVSLNL